MKLSKIVVNNHIPGIDGPDSKPPNKSTAGAKPGGEFTTPEGPPAETNTRFAKFGVERGGDESWLKISKEEADGIFPRLDEDNILGNDWSVCAGGDPIDRRSSNISAPPFWDGFVPCKKKYEAFASSNAKQLLKSENNHNGYLIRLD